MISIKLVLRCIDCLCFYWENWNFDMKPLSMRFLMKKASFPFHTSPLRTKIPVPSPRLKISRYRFCGLKVTRFVPARLAFRFLNSIGASRTAYTPTRFRGFPSLIFSRITSRRRSRFSMGFTGKASASAPE